MTIKVTIVRFAATRRPGVAPLRFARASQSAPYVNVGPSPAKAGSASADARLVAIAPGIARGATAMIPQSFAQAAGTGAMFATVVDLVDAAVVAHRAANVDAGAVDAKRRIIHPVSAAGSPWVQATGPSLLHSLGDVAASDTFRPCNLLKSAVN